MPSGGSGSATIDAMRSVGSVLVGVGVDEPLFVEPLGGVVVVLVDPEVELPALALLVPSLLGRLLLPPVFVSDDEPPCVELTGVPPSPPPQLANAKATAANDIMRSFIIAFPFKIVGPVSCDHVPTEQQSPYCTVSRGEESTII